MRAFKRLANQQSIWLVLTAAAVLALSAGGYFCQHSTVHQQQALFIAATLLLLILGLIVVLQYIFLRDTALKESEERFRYFFDANRSVMLLIEPNSGKIISANPAAARYYGYSLESLQGMSINNINILPADQVAAERQRALREERNYFNFRHKLADGEIRDVEVYSTPIKNAGRSVLFSIVHDVSTKKQTEAELIARMRELSVILDNSSVGISFVKHREQIWANNRMAELFGYEPADIQNQSTRLFYLSEEDFERLGQQAYKVLLQGKRYISEQQMCRRNGEPIWIRLSGKAIDPSSLEEGSIWVFEDISFQKQAEQQLKDQQRRLNDIISGTHVGTWEWNIQTGETVFNDLWAEMIGYTLEELSPTTIDTWVKLAHPDDLKLSGELLGKHFTGELPFYECEARLRHKDGHWIWVLDRGKVATWTKDGKPLLISGSHQDISERKQIEIDLIESRKAAESANVAKSRFLATMSHEIRTPMNGILGMAQMLLMLDVGEPERCDYARTILDSGKTLLTLLNDILDLSKIEAGRLELSVEIFEPSQLIHEVIALFSSNAQAKGLHLGGLWLGEQGQFFKADSHRLRQILANLVGNAIKFTDQGQVSIEAKPLIVNQSITMLEFSVKDTGIGIESAQQKQLFTPFSQVDNSITRKYSGTGLGLSIVRSLAKLMGGDVGVDSELNKGSRFWVHIQVEPISLGELHLYGDKQEIPFTSLATQVFSGKILVIEDNVTNQKIITALLRRLGLICVIKADGQQGTEAALQEDFDLILMDLQMPVMDGYEATRQIREGEKTAGKRHCPIIALTADAFEEDKKRCLSAGMDDFLAKPVTVDRLRSVLARFLSSAHH